MTQNPWIYWRFFAVSNRKQKEIKMFPFNAHSSRATWEIGSHWKVSRILLVGIPSFRSWYHIHLTELWKEEGPAFSRDKGNISMLRSNYHRKLYQFGKNLATWKLIEIIPFVSCEPHLPLHNFYQKVGRKQEYKKPQTNTVSLVNQNVKAWVATNRTGDEKVKIKQELGFFILWEATNIRLLSILHWNLHQWSQSRFLLWWVFWSFIAHEHIVLIYFCAAQ